MEQQFFSHIKEGVATVLSFEPHKLSDQDVRRNDQVIKDDFRLLKFLILFANTSTGNT